MIEHDTTVIQTKEIVSTVLDDETMVMSVESGKCHTLDMIGSRIWEHIARPLPVSELCARLSREYDVNQKQCEQDVIVFLNGLAEDGLVKAVAQSRLG